MKRSIFALGLWKRLSACAQRLRLLAGGSGQGWLLQTRLLPPVPESGSHYIGSCDCSGLSETAREVIRGFARLSAQTEPIPENRIAPVFAELRLLRASSRNQAAAQGMHLAGSEAQLPTDGMSSCEAAILAGILKDKISLLAGTPTQFALDTHPSASASLDFPSISAGASASLTITVSGAVTTNTPTVALGWSAALESGLVVSHAWVSGSNTVTVTLTNISGAGIDPVANTCRASVTQY